MVNPTLYSIPKRCIRGQLCVLLTDIFADHRRDAYEYARLNNGVLISGSAQDNTYISNEAFCDYIRYRT